MKKTTMAILLVSLVLAGLVADAAACGCSLSFLGYDTLKYTAKSCTVYYDYQVMSAYIGNCATGQVYTLHTNGQGHWHTWP